MKICSPSKIKTIIGTCYDKDDLIAIIHAYNKKTVICSDSKCIKSRIINIKNKSGRELHDLLSNRLNELCSNDMCWTDLDFINSISDKNLKESILYFTFKPKNTKNKTSWLNTYNINEIIEQYQDLYKHIFKFLGAQPSDFSKIIKINWKELQKSPTLGIIFNTDTHLQIGKHWVAVFINNINKTVDYFDSLGKNPNKHICGFLKHFKMYSFNINKKEYQKNNFACGIYACYFIIQRLKGLTFDEINIKLDDKIISKFRQTLFR